MSKLSLAYIKIIGPGVDALDARKEHNNNEQVTAASLQANIDRVKDANFAALKALRASRLDHAS